MILPGPFRNPKLMARIAELEAEHAAEKRAGSYAIEVHHDGEGRPVKVKLRRGDEEYLLKDSA